MGLTCKGMMFLVAFVVATTVLMELSMGEVHKVGDSFGWAPGTVDYRQWSASKNFEVGDTIVFEYNKDLQNVVRVNRKDFDSCNGDAPIATFTTGNDSFTIAKPGRHLYFICSLPGHCAAGQKVDIRVPKPSAPAPGLGRDIAPMEPLPFPFPQPSVSTLSTPSPAPAPSKNGAASQEGVVKIWFTVAVVLSFALISFAY